MLFADTFKILLIAVSVIIALPSIWIFSSVVYPDRVRRAADHAEQGLWRWLAWGIVPFVLLVWLSTALLQGGGPGQLLSAAVFTALVLGSNVGVAGLAMRLGRSMPGGDAAADVPWRQVRRGGLLLTGMYLLPLIGWVVILFGSMVMGCGIMTRMLLRGRGDRRPAETTSPAVPPPISRGPSDSAAVSPQ